MPRHALSDLRLAPDELDVDLAFPTLVLVVRHANAKYNYEYRFYGNDGRTKVEVYDISESVRTPKYLLNGSGSHYGPECPGFNYRADCKHVRVAQAVWNVWDVAAKVYFIVESPIGPIADHMLTTGTIFASWLVKYAKEATT
jgi:hypothetical protein